MSDPSAPATTLSPCILLVDDDDQLRVHIASYLVSHGYVVEEARNAAELEAALARIAVDLIVLDVMLPGEDGLSICRRVSADGAIPIIMLSAMGDETDRVVGLELGADDYLPKPCSPRELVARIKAVLRRRALDAQAQRQATEIVVAFEGFRLDLVRRKLLAPDGAVIVLSTNEFAVLSIFLRHPGRVLSREELAQMGAIEPASGIDRAIDMLISRLRRKLRVHTPIDLIVTAWGRGYRFIAHLDEGAQRLLNAVGRSAAAS